MSVAMFFDIFPWMFLLSMALVGLMVGSFLNVIIYRLPIMMENDWKAQCRIILDLSEPQEEVHKKPYNLIVPRSQCPSCNNPVAAKDNIPILSYCLLGGRCRHCKARISPRYPLIELITALVTIFIAWKYGFSLQTVLMCLFSWSLICLTMIDIDKQLLPDDITLPLLWLGLASNLLNVFTTIQSAVIGAILGYGILWLIFVVFKTLTGKEGMGYGDFKLLAMLGAWGGWQVLPFIILLSSLLGSIIGIALILFRGHQRTSPIPFGPYLAVSGWIGLIWGHEIIAYYLGFF